MEKITFPPLVAHLNEQHIFYNQLYLDHELKYGMADKDLLRKWIVGLIEPIVVEATKDSQQHLPGIFKAFYTELLRLAGTGLLLTYENEYIALWNVCLKVPSILSANPAKVLTALQGALATLRMHQPSRVISWIDLMSKTISACSTFEDMLLCGRMNAWFSGLAHLRGKCAASFPVLSPELRSALEAHNPLLLPLKKMLTQYWINRSTPEFIDAPGGFIGFGGAFSQPPLLTDTGEYVLAGDKAHLYVMFADEFGHVMLPHAGRAIPSNGNLQQFTALRKKYGRAIADFDDVSSCVVKNNTAYITRHLSHHIFVYGWSNEN